MGRPLLQVSDWEDKVEQLHQQREHLYAQADVRVTVTEGEEIDAIATRTLDLVAARILTDRLDTLLGALLKPLSKVYPWFQSTPSPQDAVHEAEATRVKKILSEGAALYPAVSWSALFVVKLWRCPP